MGRDQESCTVVVVVITRTRVYENVVVIKRTRMETGNGGHEKWPGKGGGKGRKQRRSIYCASPLSSRFIVYYQ